MTSCNDLESSVLSIIGCDVPTIALHVLTTIRDRQCYEIDSCMLVDITEPDGIWESNAATVNIRAFLPRSIGSPYAVCVETSFFFNSEF